MGTCSQAPSSNTLGVYALHVSMGWDYSDSYLPDAALVELAIGTILVIPSIHELAGGQHEEG